MTSTVDNPTLAGEPPVKRRVLPGVNKADERYATVVPKATDWCRKFVSPINSLTDPNITFLIKAAHNE